MRMCLAGIVKLANGWRMRAKRVGIIILLLLSAPVFVALGIMGEMVERALNPRK
jgi:hypothetical protein